MQYQPYDDPNERMNEMLRRHPLVILQRIHSHITARCLLDYISVETFEDSSQLLRSIIENTVVEDWKYASRW